MGRFILTPEAESDLLGIWEYISSNESESAADRVIQRLYRKMEDLAELPGQGHWRPELLDDRHKFWRVWSYLIVYRLNTMPLQVISIVHGARDLDAYFKDT